MATVTTGDAKRPFPWLTTTLTTLLLLNLALSGWLLWQRQPAIVAFDMKATLDQFMEQSASQQLSETQSKVLVDRFSQALDDSLSAWQQQHDALILVSPSVVRGAPDITRLIQHDIATRMRGAQ
jgi:conjugal transfer pilin signal peptidase TrbI